MTTSQKAIFLDRDGTLNVDHGYVDNPAKIELLPGAVEAVALLRRLGYRLLLLTNQSGVGRGYYDLAAVHACNARVTELLGLPGFDAIGIAPERPDQPSRYRKPSPAFVLEHIEQLALDPKQCWMVGDRQSDWETGRNAGIHSAAVATGKPITEVARTWLTANAVPCYADLLAFAQSLASDT